MATEFKEFKSITFDDGVQRNVVVDWNEDDETKGGRVLNKPTNLSDFNNDSGFLTKTTTSLLNYFSKTESDNKYQPKGNYEASGAANLKVDAHDASGQAHADIRENIQSLSNNKADKTAIPSKVSQLSNDSGYLTSVPSEYVTDTELNAKGYLTEHQDLSSYAKKSAIPTKTSQLSNDSGYLTEVPSEYVTDTELNAKGYLTQHQDLSAYAKTANHYTKTETDAKYQTKGNYETAGAANTALANAKSYTDTKVADVATLEVSSSKPTNTSVDLWINPTSEEFICVPEIKDETISTTDTWSSSKISSEIEAAKGAGGEAVDAYTKAESDSKYQPKGNYLTSIPSEYVTETELAAKNYLTAVPSEYVTDSELTAKGYLTTVPSTYAQTANHYTKTESDNKYQAKGSYLTSVPSEYVTETELSAKGYLTTVPSGYAKTTDHYTKTESDNKYQAKGSYETAGAANTALSSAKSYTDTKVASVSTVDVSTSEPTNASVDLWINPSDEDDIYIPEIDDTTTSNYDTWSSSKINTELNSVKESIVDKMDKSETTLGMHTDGLIYLFVDGQPIGTGITMGTSGDVIGVVDSSNNIILTGNLADGTYTLKFENADGTYTEIGSFDVGEVFDSGLFDVSTATLNNRLNSSGLPKTDSGNGGVVTDFISYVHDANRTLYIKNAYLFISASLPYTKIAFYDSNKTYLGCSECSNNNTATKPYVSILGDKYEKVQIGKLPNSSSASFIRVVLCPNGNTNALTQDDIVDIIMKYDEEIA